MRTYEAMNRLFQFNLSLATALIARVGVVALVTNRKKK
ncbi:putative holin-like toxin [Pseudobacillus badius]